MRDETLQIRKLWLGKLLKRSSDGIIYNDHEAGAIGPRLFEQAFVPRATCRWSPKGGGKATAPARARAEAFGGTICAVHWHLAVNLKIARRSHPESTPALNGFTMIWETSATSFAFSEAE